MTKKFNIKDGFNIEGFLSACRLAGVKLRAETEGEATDGCYITASNSLTVTLPNTDEDKIEIVTAKVAEFNL